MARQVLAGGGTLQAAAGAGEEAEHVGDGRQLVVQRGGVGLAAVVRFQAGQLFGVGVDGIGQLEQQQGTILRRGLRPGVEGGVGGLHGGVDLGFCCFIDFRKDATQRWVEDRLARAFASDQLAVDQQLGLHEENSRRISFL
ncbi:hypothetical protein D9M73_189070 [compost metagenome]